MARHHNFATRIDMSLLLTVVVVVVGIFFLLVTIPRIMMAVSNAKLKGKPAPTPHAGSAKRIKSGQKTILYFYTPQCGACKMQEPIIERIKKSIPVGIFKIDASRNQKAASAYGVLGVPFLVFIDGGNVVAAKAGVQPESALAGFFAS